MWIYDCDSEIMFMQFSNSDVLLYTACVKQECLHVKKQTHRQMH